jgi:hypothetical protein
MPGYQLLGTNQTSDSTLSGRYIERSLSFIQTHKNQPFSRSTCRTFGSIPAKLSRDFSGRKLRDVLEEIDHGLGRIMSTLQSEGIATNTLLTLTSDGLI